MTKKVLIAGFAGAMGQKVVNLVNNMADFEIVAGLSPHANQREHLSYQHGAFQ